MISIIIILNCTCQETLVEIAGARCSWLSSLS